MAHKCGFFGHKKVRPEKGDNIFLPRGSDMKKCSKCGKSKKLAEFHKQVSSPDGRKPRCKVCRNGDNKKYREDNPEYYEKWRAENKDYTREYNAQHHSDHREEANKKRLENARQNPEREATRKSEWYKDNSDDAREKSRQWKLDNPDKVREQCRRRRDREVACGENYTAAHEKITLKAFGNKCFKCKSGDRLHIDHHRPLVKGHPLSLNNAVVLCLSCNSSKGTKNPEKFYGKRVCIKLDNLLAKIKRANS